MRYLMLLAAFATLVTNAQPGPGGPADSASPSGAAPTADLPLLIEPALRAEGPEALQRSDAAHAGADAPHDHDSHGALAEPAPLPSPAEQDPHAGHAAPGKDDAIAPPGKDHGGHGKHHGKHHGNGGDGAGSHGEGHQ